MALLRRLYSGFSSYFFTSSCRISCSCWRRLELRWNLSCPDCGRADGIDIAAAVWVRLCRDETDGTLAHNGDHKCDDTGGYLSTSPLRWTSAASFAASTHHVSKPRAYFGAITGRSNLSQ